MLYRQFVSSRTQISEGREQISQLQKSLNERITMNDALSIELEGLKLTTK